MSIRLFGINYRNPAPMKINMADYIVPRIHPEGWPFIALFAVLTVLLAWIWSPLGWLGGALTLWCATFFRDPNRMTPVRDGLVVSSADGLVCFVGASAPPPELKMSAASVLKISVFMSVFDVHINRSPLDGTVAHVVYIPGKFLNASLDKASEDNERLGMRLTLDDGTEVGVVQIAGLVARRIKCFAQVGQRLLAGQRFGLIRFGSRVDIYLPEGVVPLVVPGQRTVAGETVLADFTTGEAPRIGEVR